MHRNPALSAVPAGPNRPVAAGLCAALILAFTGVANAPMAAGAPLATITHDGDPLTFVEQSGESLDIGTDLTIDTPSTFDGGHVNFATTDLQTGEELSLDVSAEPATELGAVSVVGTTVYLGDGATADLIGSVDDTYDGLDGRPLRVNFVSDFANASFESGDTSGWTTLNHRIDLGDDVIATYETVDTSTYPIGDKGAPNEDNNVPTTMGNYSTNAVPGDARHGTYALELSSTGITTQFGYDVVHGPAAYSSTFEAEEGDTISFDWRAEAGGDAHHVFGYIVDEAGDQTELLDAVGADDSGSTAWATKSTTIPNSGTYRFVFVSGTYDFTGAKGAGARLLIDDVRVYGDNVTGEVLSKIARLLQYTNTGNNPPAEIHLEVTVADSDGHSATATPVTVQVELVDDPPALQTPTPISYSNSQATQIFAHGSGDLSATDPEGDDIGFSLEGGVDHPVTIDGVEYTAAAEGTYGTVYTNATGDYVFVPDSGAIDAALLPTSETFTVEANALELTATAPFVVNIEVPETASSAPTGLRARPGNERVRLTWDQATWLGGSAVVDYVVYYSDDGGHHWTVFDDGIGSTTSADVDGLTNGVEYEFRVVAINATGPSAPAISDPLAPRRPLVVPDPDPAPGPPTPSPAPGTLPTPPLPALDRTPTGTLHRIYLTLFNRVAEPTGLEYWTGRHESGLPMRSIVVGFLRSPEWRDHHNDPHGPELVHKLYLTVLGRGPDAHGLSYWIGLLNDGRITETQLVLSFVDSPEMADRIRGALGLG